MESGYSRLGQVLAECPQAFNLWLQAKLHTQWPGTGRIGDPVFDAFYATQVPYLADNAQTQRLNQQAVAALLDRTVAVTVTGRSRGRWFFYSIKMTISR